jgi:putative spermidine/putrescine transport system substrate-binding protein
MQVTGTGAVRTLRLDKRQLFFYGAAAVTAVALPSGGASGLSCEKVVVGTWGGDFSKVIETTIGGPTKSATGAEFVADVGAAGARKARLLAERDRPAGSMDIACLDSFDMHQMATQNLLLPLDASAVPNLANVNPAFARPYAAPLAFSGKVIVYNPDKMPAPKSYRDLWLGAYAGKIGVADLLSVHVIEAAALIAGGSATNYEPGKAKLMELKASGVKLYPSNEALAAALSSGEVWATIMWRARAYQWKKAGLPIASVVPEEGATPITFELAAARNAPNKPCALSFLNQSLDPVTQVKFAEQMGYVPTVANASLAPELAGQLDFTAAERANFFKQDLTYLNENQPQLIDWWTRVFKA